MFAIHLQSILSELCQKAEMCPLAHDDMAQRFQSLRGYGRLPSGRVKRGQPLTDEQIASAILGLATTMPGWAGHAAAVMEGKLPVGGAEGSFAGARSLHQALINILSDAKIRETLVAVHLSTVEAGVNSNGTASIIYNVRRNRFQTSYVSSQAISLLEPGAIDRFDPEKPYATFGRGAVFSRSFFECLSARIEYDRKFPPPLPNESLEYDTEEAEAARRKRLGATPHSRFLNLGVDNHVNWPREEQLITFDRYKIVLMPKKSDYMQSISIDLYKNQLTVPEAKMVINRFLSLLSWCDDHFAIAQDGWSGNPVPVPVRKRNLAFTTTSHWIFDRSIPTSSDVLGALALYREARNAEQNFMVSYAVLNYYKILELRHAAWPDATKWIAANLPNILNDDHDRQGITNFRAACGNESPEIYIYAACRVAVAHASPNRPSDPDDAAELQRLHNAADVMRRLARFFIKHELDFSDRRWE